MHQAITRNQQGEFKIDLNVVRQMAEAFDAGTRTEECVIAKFIVAAYEMGFDHGTSESEARQMQTMMLMMHTGGHA